jgi:hypothetical protein
LNLSAFHDPTQSYEHLREAFLRLYPSWKEEFGITKVKKLQLVYLNVLNQATLPEFHDGNSLFLDRVLTVFSTIPGEHECLMPPCDCRVTVRLSEPENAALEIHLKDSPSERGMRLRLNVGVKLPSADASLETVASLLDLCHKRIVERFELLFTAEARNSFKSLDQ